MKRKKRYIRKLLYAFVAVTVMGVAAAYMFSRVFFGNSVVPKSAAAVMFVPAGASYSAVVDTLNRYLTIKNRAAFDWLAKKKRYPELIKPGRYTVREAMSINGLINMLRSGSQATVKVTFNNIRTLNQLAGRFARQLETDSAGFVSFFANEDNYSSDGFTKENIISIFIPDTYEFYWNTDAKGIYTRMLREYNRFWTPERTAKAEAAGLSRIDVSIIASIIDDEVLKREEKPRIAGVYLNRLRQGIALQACPTIKFAMNDFTITRVLDRYLTVESPYNTYKYRGLPPGPVGCASIDGIDATLNAEKHDYLFFSAKADFSGYHNFARTLAQHNRFAAEYHRELDRRRIFR